MFSALRSTHPKQCEPRLELLLPFGGNAEQLDGLRPIFVLDALADCAHECLQFGGLVGFVFAVVVRAQDVVPVGSHAALQNRQAGADVAVGELVRLTASALALRCAWWR